jgi:hypothetical protein
MKKNQFIILFVFIIIFNQCILTSAFFIPSHLPHPSDQRTMSPITPLNLLSSKANSFVGLPFIPSFQSTTNPLSPSFNPEDLILSDNAYHESNQSYAIEWWYFDALLNQRYTIQFSIHIYEILTTGFATIQCHIYDDGTPIISERTFKPISTMTLSEDNPYIAIDHKSVLTYRRNGSEIPQTYFIDYSGSNFSFNLTFQGITDGWKGTTLASDWAVILPKAKVNGILTMNGINTSVSGIGYHDHNWNVRISTGLNFGWLWGKINTEEHTLTWASIFETWYKQHPLLVINKDNNGYESISPDQFDISVTDIRFKDKMIIPYGFSISSYSSDLSFELTITVLDTDYISILGVINYWRYHVHITGTFNNGDQTETIQDHNIAEFIRFRPY